MCLPCRVYSVVSFRSPYWLRGLAVLLMGVVRRFCCLFGGFVVCVAKEVWRGICRLRGLFNVYTVKKGKKIMNKLDLFLSIMFIWSVLDDFVYGESLCSLVSVCNALLISPFSFSYFYLPFLPPIISPFPFFLLPLVMY